ncbi:MAG: HipA domain-containing protein [Deltaproteobacteria bacterium]|nr:HipA domain-containing protein [Deltaproteobacteria bacterium]
MTRLSELREVEELAVFKKERRAGSLRRTTEGAAFEYDSEYFLELQRDPALALASTLGAQAQTHEVRGVNLHPFFAGLLPEGLRQKALLSALKTSADDLFSMLAAGGGDTIGDVSVALDGGEPRVTRERSLPSVDEIDFNEMFHAVIGVDSLAERKRDVMIAGVQPKLSAQRISFPVALKKRNRNCILKLGSPEYPRLVHNEHFCMSAARACGVDVALTEIVLDRGGNAGLLVERFDRVPVGKSSRFTSLHQEDACQFLGRYPQDKYRLTLREICGGLGDVCTSPIIETSHLLRQYLFSYLIGNGDLHAKNISVLESRDGIRTGLAPAYDLVSTLPYGDEEMALQLDGKRGNFKRENFLTFGERVGVRRAAVEQLLDRTLRAWSRILPTSATVGWDEKSTRTIHKALERRARVLSEESPGGKRRA